MDDSVWQFFSKAESDGVEALEESGADQSNRRPIACAALGRRRVLGGAVAAIMAIHGVFD